MSHADQKRILSLDILRGIAILMVVLGHNVTYPDSRGLWYAPIHLLHLIGWSGVDLFFIMSGYLVGGLLLNELKAKNDLRIKRFIIRRGFKIWPTYYIFLLIFWPVYSFKERHSLGLFESLLHHFKVLLPNFFHVQNYFPQTAPAGWLWSLSIEEHFYLALPLVLYFLHKKNINLFTSTKRLIVSFFILIIFFLGLRWHTMSLIPLNPDDAYTFIFPSHLRFDSLLAGVFLAGFDIYNPNAHQRLKPYRYLFLITGLILVSTFLYHKGLNQFFLYPYGLTILLLGYFLIVLFTSFYKKRQMDISFKEASLIKKPFVIIGLVLGHIGVRSYSIYVWHGFFAKPIANRICQFMNLTGEHPYLGLINEFVFLTIPLVLGYIVYYLVEGPFLKLREKIKS